MIGVACNSRIPQAYLHAVHNFVLAKNCSQYVGNSYLKVLLVSTLVGTGVQNELRLKKKNFLVVIKKVVHRLICHGCVKSYSETGVRPPSSL